MKKQKKLPSAKVVGTKKQKKMALAEIDGGISKNQMVLSHVAKAILLFKESSATRGLIELRLFELYIKSKYGCSGS